MDFQNTHHWADENPHEIKQSRFQNTFLFNVWIGIVGDSLIGSVFLPSRLRSNLVAFPPKQLFGSHGNCDPKHQASHVVYAPPQLSHNVRVYLNQQFRKQWIGHGGPIALPARSLDLNPIDSFVWGHLKSIVYATPVDNIKKLRERIEDGWRRIRQITGIFRRLRQSMDNDWSSVWLSTEVTSSTSSNGKSSIARHSQQREQKYTVLFHYFCT